MVLGIYGAGGLGREVLELARQANRAGKRWDGMIFIDDDPPAGKVNGIGACRYEEALAEYGGGLEVSVAVGEPAIREKLFARLAEDHVGAATLVHPDVHVPDTASIGDGVTIQAGTFLSCNAVVEDYVYIQPNVNIGHDDVLRKGCVISGLCNLAGAVEIGEYTYLGMSACCKEQVKVGRYSVVGMGSMVYKDIPDEVIALGNPARPMRRNEGRRVFG